MSLPRRFWAMWTASTVSNLGDGIVLAALPLLAIHLTHEPIGVAAVTIAIRLPWLFFAMFSGVLVDRTDRLRLMISTDMVRAALFAGIAVLVVTDQMTLPILYAFVFATGTLETIFDTAAMSITPGLVGADQIETANSRLDSAQTTANELVGPSLGGLFFAATAWLPFGVNSASFMISVVLLASIGGQYRPPPRTTSVIADAREGFQFLWHERGIRAFAVGAGLINLGQTAALSLLVLHADENLDVSDAGFGILLAAGAVGGIIGSVAAPTVTAGLGKRRSVTVAVVAMAVSLVLVGVTDEAIVAAAGLALSAFSASVWNIVSITYRQTATPDPLLGRVMAGFRVIAYGAFPFGAALGGLTADLINVRAAFIVGAVLISTLIPILAITLPASLLEHTTQAAPGAPPE